MNASATSRRTWPPAVAMYEVELVIGMKKVFVVRVTTGVVVEVFVTVVVVEKVVVILTVFVEVCVMVAVNASVS